MLWSKLITKKLSCPKSGGEKGEMTCTMDMESYGYTAEDVSYELKDGDKSFGAGQQEKKLELHCKKRSSIFQFPAGMSLTKLCLARNN
jgi:hypothetical protein